MFASIAVPVPACAGTIVVSSNGADSPTCGAKPASACATIGQAVANASDGDSIVVWPGMYAGTTITKSVSLTPTSGGGGAILTGSTQLAANGIVLGKRGKGFSIQDGNVTVSAADVVVRGNYFSNGTNCLQVAAGNDTVIRDNSFTNCDIGVLLSTTGVEVRGNRFAYMNQAAVFLDAPSSSCVLRENRMSGPGGVGVVIQGSDHLLRRNLVQSVAAGGFVANLSATNVTLLENLVVNSNAPAYNLTSGTGWILEKNASVGCGAPGFYLAAGTTLLLTDNVSMGSAVAGFLIVGGSDHVLDGNSAIDNDAVGIQLGSVGTGVSVIGGNLYGNGGSGSNCGLTNSSANLVQTSDIFWGDPSGPGVDPADAVCDNIGATVVDNPARSADKVKMPRIK
jgi:nitrous oxidase accessory protein NosD